MCSNAYLGLAVSVKFFRKVFFTFIDVIARLKCHLDEDKLSIQRLWFWGLDMISHCQLIHSTLTELFSLRNSPGGKSSRRSEGGNLQFKILFEMKLKMVLELYLRKHSRLILFFLAYILIYQRKTELFSSLYFKGFFLFP